MECTECNDPACPGIIVCPKCGIGEHGISAETHVIDHGICWECLHDWMYHCENHSIFDEEE